MLLNLMFGITAVLFICETPQGRGSHGGADTCQAVGCFAPGIVSPHRIYVLLPKYDL